jgi:L1 cell adhesion molecule like protein
MADIALGSLERIIKVALKIKKAVRTVQQNEEECQALEKEVAIVIAILSSLQVMRAVTPAMTLALMGLEEKVPGEAHLRAPSRHGE